MSDHQAIRAIQENIQKMARSTQDTGGLRQQWSQLLGQIIDANPVPCFVIDENHVITHWNKACEQILGKRATEMIGTRKQWSAFYAQERATLADLIVDDVVEQIYEGPYLDKEIKASDTIRGAYVAQDYFPHLGKEGRWLDFTAAPIRDARGHIIGAVETLRDISRERKAEIQLQMMNRQLESQIVRRTAQLAELNRELEESLARAEELNRLKSMFLASISHELRTPLNGILGFSELIRMDPSDENIDQYADMIHLSARRLDHSLSDLLSLSELTAGRAEKTNWPFAPDELLQGMVMKFELEARKKGLSLSYESTPLAPQMICGDGTRFMHCVESLIENAIKYTEQGEVKVELGRATDSSQLSLKVMDTGPGIAQHEQEKIFQMFAQSTGQGVGDYHEGMGIGLALAKAQAVFLGGDLSVSSQPGQGAVFTLTLPIGT